MPDEALLNKAGIDMLVNRRRSERHLCKRVAKIQFGTGSLPRDCTITDISDGGAKVFADMKRLAREHGVAVHDVAERGPFEKLLVLLHR